MTDEELLAELEAVGDPDVREDRITDRAANAVAVARLSICLGCEFQKGTVCQKGPFSVYRQAANADAGCPEGKWA